MDNFLAASLPPVLAQQSAARRLEEITRSTVGVIDADYRRVDFVGTRVDGIHITPKPFQRLAIPYALSGANMIVASEAGSGKTLVFLMAVFMNAFPLDSEAGATGLRAIVIVPKFSRPLVQQHATTFRRVARRLKENGDPFWASVQDPHESVSCTTWQYGSGGRDDRRDKFPRALIRIDTADRILSSARGDDTVPPEAFFSNVSVIVIDQVDKCLSPEAQGSDKRDVSMISQFCPNSQIISASATISRQAELRPGVRDAATTWLGEKSFRTCRPGSGPRDLLCVQTENVMPANVFHLLVDMRAGDQQEEIQLAWEKLLTCSDFRTFKRSTEVTPSACLLLWNDSPTMIIKRAAIQASFCDKRYSGARQYNFPVIAPLATGMTLDQRKKVMGDLLSGQLTGCLSTNASAAVFDFPFASVSHSRPPLHTTWDSYIHSSGQCGRRRNQLGVSIIYIKNDVRRFMFVVALQQCSPWFHLSRFAG